MKFKTNAKCGGCVAAIGRELDKIMTSDDWSIDLSSAERILTVTADVDAGDVLQRVAAAGFKAEVIE